MIQSVKLSKLVRSSTNVRKRRTDKAESFAASIAANGVLQNLIVTPLKKPRGHFGIVAGESRYDGLMLLVERGQINADDYDVPVKLMTGADSELSEVSLVENFQRDAMNPADECRGFQLILAQGGDIDELAKRFHVTRRFVEGRLRLATLAEPIFEALSDDKISFEMAKAYGSTASHETQLRVWGSYGAMSHYNSDAIRRVIANDMMRANDPVALLVGAEAYEAAGGVVDRDLFSNAGEKWLHPAIAQTLAAAIMEAEAARIGEERGLAWIRPIATHSAWDATRDLHKIRLPEQPMTLAEAERAEQIAGRVAELEEEMQNEEMSEDAFAALEREHETISEEFGALERRPAFLPPELAPRVGAFLTLSQSGTMVLDQSYYSETPIRVTVVEPEAVEGDAEGGDAGKQDDAEIGDGVSERVNPAPTFRIEEVSTTSTTGSTERAGDPDNAAPGGKALSQVLSDQLAMQRRDVLGAALIASPGLALDYMLFAIVDGRRGASANDGTTIRADKPQDPILANNMPGSRARDYLNEVHEGLDASWTESHDQVVRFEAFRALGDEVKTAWLAYIVATSLEAKMSYSTNRQNPLHGRLATILDIDVASWWRPTSENFFDRVSKGSLVSLLHEVGGPALSSRHATEKKPEVSASCQKLFGGDAIVEPAIKEAALKWLPPAMCFTNPVTEVEGDDGDGDGAQGDLADLIEAGDDGIDAEAEDGDDLAALIGDDPEDADAEDQQAGSDVAAELEHHNDDGVEPEVVAAE